MKRLPGLGARLSGLRLQASNGGPGRIQVALQPAPLQSARRHLLQRALQLRPPRACAGAPHRPGRTPALLALLAPPPCRPPPALLPAPLSAPLSAPLPAITSASQQDLYLQFFGTSAGTSCHQLCLHLCLPLYLH